MFSAKSTVVAPTTDECFRLVTQGKDLLWALGRGVLKTAGTAVVAYAVMRLTTHWFVRAVQRRLLRRRQAAIEAYHQGAGSYTHDTDRAVALELSIVGEWRLAAETALTFLANWQAEQWKRYRNPLSTPAEYQDHFESRLEQLTLQYDWAITLRDRLVMQLGDISVLQPHELYQQCLRHFNAVCSDEDRAGRPISRFDQQVVRDAFASLRRTHVPRQISR